MIRIFFLSVFLFPEIVIAQDIKYAHYLVDTLTAPGMEGRGYVNEGDKKAANFITGEYRKFKLESFTGGYFQPFHFPVNTFPGNMEVKVNSKILIPGIDYIVDPTCVKIKGSFSVVSLFEGPGKTSASKVKNKMILLDKSKATNKEEGDRLNQWFEDIHGAAGILVIEEKKLTWSVASYQRSFPIIHILNQSLPEEPHSISMKIDARLLEKHETNNIIGYIRGSLIPDSFLVFSAHYDHLGRMGKATYFPGANDNSSGVSMLLNLIQHYSKPENKPKYSMVFIAFAGEEAGLLGSQYYTENPIFPLTKIKFLLNMDLLGTGDDGMMVVNGDVFKPEFELLNKLNNEHQYLKTLGKRGKAKNSDHYYFSEKGVPCFFFYTLGGISAYHDVNDKGASLPFTDFEDVFRLILDFEAEISK